MLLFTDVAIWVLNSQIFIPEQGKIEYNYKLIEGSSEPNENTNHGNAAVGQSKDEDVEAANSSTESLSSKNKQPKLTVYTLNTMVSKLYKCCSI